MCWLLGRVGTLLVSVAGTAAVGYLYFFLVCPSAFVCVSISNKGMSSLRGFASLPFLAS